MRKYGVIFLVFISVMILTSISLSAASKISVQTLNSSKSAYTNTISVSYKIKNLSDVAMDLTKLKLNYYYEKCEKVKESSWCDYALLTSGNNEIKFNTQDVVSSVFTYDGVDTDSYIMTSFKKGILNPNDELVVHIVTMKDDWSNYNQLNDFSFSKSTKYFENTKISYQYEGITYGSMPAVKTETPKEITKLEISLNEYPCNEIKSNIHADVYLKNLEVTNGISSCKFVLQFDKDYLDYKSGYSGAIISSDKDKNFKVTSPASGLLELNYQDPTFGNELILNNGEFAKLTFLVKKQGETTIKVLENDTVYGWNIIDKNLNPIDTIFKSITFLLN